MAYSCDIGNGQRLLAQNDGDKTQVALSSGDSGQQQNQSTGFTTGEWSKPPELFRTSDNLVLRVEGKNGVQLLDQLVVSGPVPASADDGDGASHPAFRVHQTGAEQLHEGGAGPNRDGSEPSGDPLLEIAASEDRVGVVPRWQSINRCLQRKVTG